VLMKGMVATRVAPTVVCCSNYDGGEDRLELKYVDRSDQYFVADAAGSLLLYPMCEMEWLCPAGFACTGDSMVRRLSLMRAYVPQNGHSNEASFLCLDPA